MLIFICLIHTQRNRANMNQVQNTMKKNSSKRIISNTTIKVYLFLQIHFRHFHARYIF